MSFENLEPLFPRYKSKGVLIDTNLLLLLLIGCVDPKLLSKFKPTANRGFTPDDLELLQWILARFSKILTTPHVLAEVGNHTEKLKGHPGQALIDRLIALVNRADEFYVRSRELTAKDGFREFGLTHAAIAHLPCEQYLVLTVDFPLAGWLEKRGIDVINFNRLRPQAWYRR